MELPHLTVETDAPARARVAILHSNGFCAAHYRPVMEHLAARGIRATAIDLPGFAAPRPEVLGWDGLIAAVEGDVREALGPEGVLVGHSLGGLLAIQLAERVRPRALVLVEPAIVPWRWLARIAARLYVRRVFDGEPGFANRGPWFWRLHDPDTYDPAWIALSQRTHANADREAVAALHLGLPDRYPLPFPDLPVVAVRGASSGIVMKWGQDDLLRRFPRSRAVTLPDAGHWMLGEQDALLADAIASAVEAIPP